MPWEWLLQDGFFFSLRSISIAFFLPFLVLVVLGRCLPRDPKREKPRLPPSPPKLPLLGNLHQLSSLPHRSLRDLAREHGPLMLLHLGQVPILVVSSAEAAREVMKSRDLAFATRPWSKPSDTLTYGSRDISFAPYGDYWRQAKKVAVVHLLNPKKVQSFRRVREEEVALMVDKIAAACSSPPAPVDLSELFYSFSNGLVRRIVFGSCSDGDERTKLFREVIEETTVAIGGFRWEDLFPSLAWLGALPGMDSTVKKLFKKSDGLLDQIVEEHEQRREEDRDGGSESSDFVDVLLSIHRDPASDFSITRNDVKSIMLDMVVAGTDTTYVVLVWAMAELVRNPVAMERARKEVREVTRGKPMATEEDTTQMSYLTAVVKEVLRVHPPAPLLLPRESMEDVRVQGYDVPAKTRVLINAWAISTDPEWWEAPDEFRPERFLGDPTAADFRGNDFQFIPFGAGRRVCPAINFAVCGIHLALANLLNRFDWALPRGMLVQDFDMEESPGLAIRRKLGLRLEAIPHSNTTPKVATT